MLGHRHPVVEVEGFSGPFDLLLRLIERRELDVLAISLAAVTEQYLEHLSELRLRDPEHLTAFLVVAAKLLYIKSSLLLPGRSRATTDENTPDDPADLAARLAVYRSFRQAAVDLAARLDAGLRMYPHPPIAYQPRERERAAPLDPNLLRAAFLQAQGRTKVDEPRVVEATPRLSVTEALSLLRVALERYATIALSELVESEPSRQRVVAVFLAVLELVRQGHATVAQEEYFGEIQVGRAGVNDSVEGRSF